MSGLEVLHKHDVQTKNRKIALALVLLFFTVFSLYFWPRSYTIAPASSQKVRLDNSSATVGVINLKQQSSAQSEPVTHQATAPVSTNQSTQATAGKPWKIVSLNPNYEVG